MRYGCLGFLDSAELAESCVAWLGQSKRADETEEPSVVEERVKMEDDIETGQGEAEEADMWSPDTWVEVGRLEDDEAFGRVRTSTAKRTGHPYAGRRGDELRRCWVAGDLDL